MLRGNRFSYGCFQLLRNNFGRRYFTPVKVLGLSRRPKRSVGTYEVMYTLRSKCIETPEEGVRKHSLVYLPLHYGH